MTIARRFQRREEWEISPRAGGTPEFSTKTLQPPGSPACSSKSFMRPVTASNSSQEMLARQLRHASITRLILRDRGRLISLVFLLILAACPTMLAQQSPTAGSTAPTSSAADDKSEGPTRRMNFEKPRRIQLPILLVSRFRTTLRSTLTPSAARRMCSKLNPSSRCISPKVDAHQPHYSAPCVAAVSKPTDWR